MSRENQQYARMLYFTAIHFKQGRAFESFDDGLAWARSLPYFVDEVENLLGHLVETSRSIPKQLDIGRPTVLKSHAHYKREEILSGLDIATWEKKQDSHREGVMYSAEYNVDAFLVTLRKDTNSFSPTTMYKDFALSRSRFHWESQNSASARSAVGQRYLEKAHGRSGTLIFVRGSGNDGIADGAAFLNLGVVDFAEWNGSERPMQITWTCSVQCPSTSSRMRALSADGNDVGKQLTAAAEAGGVHSSGLGRFNGEWASRSAPPRTQSA